MPIRVGIAATLSVAILALVAPSMALAITPPGIKSVKCVVREAPKGEGEEIVGGSGEEGSREEEGFCIPCRNFPFGVPCWLVKQFQEWTAAPEAPQLGFAAFNICVIATCAHFPETYFNVAPLDPIMEVVRPAMLVFATIGLLILMWNFTHGAGTVSGSQGDSELGESSHA